MGIPSYFSYIVKNHARIIKKLNKNTLHIDNLYMDCNSIIYDAVHNIDFTKIQSSRHSKSIIDHVIDKINEYISLINPNKYIFIAFDGVAPVAKLDQQRSRRYKSTFQATMSQNVLKKSIQDTWNTTAITPGTIFMSELSSSITAYFNDPAKYSVNQIIVSTSDEPGEGEHKIFEFIRKYSLVHSTLSTVIYGLDADLIMLSINHLPISTKIYLFRETPHFISSLDSSLEPNDTYLLDIPELAEIITLDMNNGVELTTIQQKNRIYDYIFLCFFLGNDFMPHFPAVNIRTGGIDKLLAAYKATIGKTNENLTNGSTIYWKNVRKLVAFLADSEEEYLKQETKLRDRREKYSAKVSENKESDKESDKDKDKDSELAYARFESIPTYEREVEKYINPYKPKWQNRYYKTLFEVDIDDARRQQISINYLEGLEWTMTYYTTGCKDWRWCYQYHYPPLLQDLLKYIPYFDTTFVQLKPPQPVSQLVQLSYVLPRQSLGLLPKALCDKLLADYDEKYNDNCEFVWAYCRYFWESHVKLPEINIDELEQIVTGASTRINNK